MERQRVQAALEQQRLQQDMEIRRAHVAKTRPTWMLAITGIALVAAIGLIFFAIQRKRASEAAEEAAEIAKKASAQAVEDARVARKQVDDLMRQTKDLDDKVTVAIDAVGKAKSLSEQRAAQAELDKLRQQKIEMDARMAAARDAAEKAKRREGIHLSKECLENPLAKGCS
jgi:hypothetical protein